MFTGCNSVKTFFGFYGPSVLKKIWGFSKFDAIFILKFLVTEANGFKIQRRNGNIISIVFHKTNPASLGYLKMFTGCNSVKTFFGVIINDKEIFWHLRCRIPNFPWAVGPQGKLGKIHLIFKDSYLIPPGVTELHPIPRPG
jgi:hypothetical protein